MDVLDRKLYVLTRVARELNEAKITWAVGASLLLYLEGITDIFHDIDLMILERDIDRAVAVMERFGKPSLPNPACGFKTRRFLEYSIDGVDFDLMAGFVIVKEGVDYDCSLRPEQIKRGVTLNGVEIPLQSVRDWRRFYDLMGRTEKVEMIDAAIKCGLNK